MPLINLNHEHTWVRLGVAGGPLSTDKARVVYECAHCNAWTTRDLVNSAYVPHREGSFTSTRSVNDDA